MLRDRLVCGVNDEQIQRRLLAESSLDFKKALKIATSMETAVKSSRELANQMAKEDVKSESSTTVHRVDNYSQRNQQSLKPECGRCGGKHDPQQCKFLEAECFLCKERTHRTKMSKPHQVQDRWKKSETANFRCQWQLFRHGSRRD